MVTMQNWLRNLTYAAVLLWALTGLIGNLGRNASASPSLSVTGCVVDAAGQSIYLCSDGNFYVLNKDGWYLLDNAATGPLPLPSNEIAFASRQTFVDVRGHGWAVNYTTNQWVEVGPPPCAPAPIPVKRSTWSDIKSLNK